MSSTNSDLWTNYWGNDTFWINSKIWKANASIFMKKIPKYLDLSAQDRVLTLGCGAGHLEALLAPRVHSITAADTSDTMIKACRNRLRSFSNIQFVLLPARNPNFKSLGKFSLIIAASVIQYLDEDSIMKWLSQAREASLSGGKMLISDIPLERSINNHWKHHALHGIRALRHGYLIELLKLISRVSAKSQPYQQIEQRSPARRFSIEQLQDLMRGFPNSQMLWESFSIHPDRVSLLISF